MTDRPQHHVDRYADLPEEVRSWLEHMRSEDVSQLQNTIAFYRWASTTSRYVKWSVLFILGIFITTATAGDSILKVWHWMFPVKPGG